MDIFSLSSFGLFLHQHLRSFFSQRSWTSFLYLAYGWSVCRYHHTIAQYIWLSGGAEVKHFTRYYSFLSLTFLELIDQLWGVVLSLLDGLIAQEVVLQLALDDTTCKKSGRKIKGASTYRNGAGSARQEYRSLWGLNFVCLSLCWNWQGHRLSLPLGLRLYLKEGVARKLRRPFYSRSQLGRQMLDLVARHLPHRQVLILVDGGYATKAFLRQLPPNVHVLGRFPVSSQLYELPPPRNGKPKVGRPPKKGASLLGPKQWKESAKGWKKHPTEPKLRFRTHLGIWHSVLPEVPIRVIAIWRIDFQKNSPRSKQKELEAFFTTSLQIQALQILPIYAQRWDIEITIRDANAFYGLAKDRCRNPDRITAINAFRLLMATLRCIWVCQNTPKAQFNLKRLRPWYRKKSKLSQFDIQTLFEELLYAQGILPTIRFLQDVPEMSNTCTQHKSRAA